VVALLVLGALVAVAVAAAAVYVLSEMKLNRTIAPPAESIVVPSDIASIQRGQHVVGAIALCTECHAPNLAGSVVLDAASARVVAPNLTRGGIGATFRDADYARAIRDGLDPGGRQLWMMPSDDYHVITDTDLSDVIAYLKSLPPITTALPTNEIRPFGRVLVAVGQLELVPAASIDRSAPRPTAVSPAITPEYGAYLVNLAGCARCHGPGLSGGKVPGARPSSNSVAATNITPAALADWSEADFLRAMRSGRRPDARQIDTSMPWPYYAQMTDLELRAIWQFLGVIPARPTGTG
jgi:cytochrome c553